MHARVIYGYDTRSKPGGMAEWFMATVLKTVVSARAPWVRIPLPPPFDAALDKLDPCSWQAAANVLSLSKDLCALSYI